MLERLPGTHKALSSSYSRKGEIKRKEDGKEERMEGKIKKKEGKERRKEGKNEEGGK